MDINASVATADGALVGPHNLRPLEDTTPESQDYNSEAASNEEGLFAFVCANIYKKKRKCTMRHFCLVVLREFELSKC